MAKRQKLEIGLPLTIEVCWYDHLPEPPQDRAHQGEVIGWRDTQVIVRVKDYAVVRFWKGNGLEVGNAAHALRGFKIDLDGLKESVKASKGVEVAIDTDA